MGKGSCSISEFPPAPPVTAPCPRPLERQEGRERRPLAHFILGRTSEGSALAFLWRSRLAEFELKEGSCCVALLSTRTRLGVRNWPSWSGSPARYLHALRRFRERLGHFGYHVAVRTSRTPRQGDLLPPFFWTCPQSQEGAPGSSLVLQIPELCESRHGPQQVRFPPARRPGLPNGGNLWCLSDRLNGKQNKSSSPKENGMAKWEGRE